MPAILLLLLACAPESWLADSFTGALTWEDAWPQGDAAADLFGLERVAVVDLTLGAGERTALVEDPYSYVPAGLTVDGAALGQVGLRLKGRSGSFRDLDGKPSFKLDLDRYTSDVSWAGLRKIDLDNLVVDCAAARDRLALRAFAATGQPASRVGYARVSLDGEDLGLYGLLENVDATFLAGRYRDPSGNLYDGDYVIDGDFETQVDFAPDLQDWFELDEGRDVDLADVRAVTAALDAGGEALGAPAQVVDWPRVARMIAVEAWVGQVDGYALQANNYRVYFDPGTGRAELIPWDLDFTFIPATEWDSDWRDPRGRLGAVCLLDAHCRLGFEAVARRSADAIEAADLGAELDAIDALVRPELATDPRCECTLEEHDAEVEWLRGWIAGASAVQRARWAGVL